MSTRRKTATRLAEPSPPRTRPSRSPARNRKVSPARKSSPARQSAPKPKSPARKSPSRNAPSKYPARKSPARTVKEVKPVEPEPQKVAPKSPAKRPALKTDAILRLEDVLSPKSDIYRSTRSKRIEYTVKDVTLHREYSTEKENGLSEMYELRNRVSVEEVTPRRSSRLRDIIDTPTLPDIRRSVSKTATISRSSKSVSKSLDKYSDEENSADEDHTEKRQYVTRKLSTPLRNSVSNIIQIARRWEFGGRIGTAALIVLMPLTVLSILNACMNTCSFNTLLNLSLFKSISLWFNVPTSALIVAQISLQALIAVMPYMGPKSDGMDDTGRKHCFNAFFSSIVAITLLYQLDYVQFLNKNSLLGEYLKLATASYIFAVILSVILYMKSEKLDKADRNQYGNTGYFLYDFFMGREIHPCIKSLDVKIWISRICNINTLILSLLIFTQGIKLRLNGGIGNGTEEYTIENFTNLLGKVQFECANPTAAIFSMMQIIYILVFIVREYRVTSTFYWHSEGVGYLQLVASALYPFYFTTVSKYIIDAGVTLSTNVLVIASVLYSLGLILMLVSNNIKYEFRRDPLQPRMADLDSMITFSGKRLITSNLWGILRHPNYAGDILIHIVLSLPGLLTGHPIAASPALITVLVLLHRAWRDDARCQRRYGSAWQRYCQKVPSVIIPKIL